MNHHIIIFLGPQFNLLKLVCISVILNAKYLYSTESETEPTLTLLQSVCVTVGASQTSNTSFESFAKEIKQRRKKFVQVALSSF